MQENDSAYHEPKIEDIEDAIHVLLTDYVEQRERPRGVKDWYPGGRLMSPSFILDDKKDWDLHDMACDPIREVLRYGIRTLGQHLFFAFLKRAQEYGGSPSLDMQGSCYRIAERDKKNEDDRASYLDKIWDGVGNDSWRWMA